MGTVLRKAESLDCLPSQPDSIDDPRSVLAPFGRISFSDLQGYINCRSRGWRYVEANSCGFSIMLRVVDVSRLPQASLYLETAPNLIDLLELEQYYPIPAQSYASVVSTEYDPARMLSELHHCRNWLEIEHWIDQHDIAGVKVEPCLTRVGEPSADYILTLDDKFYRMRTLSRIKNVLARYV